MEGSAAAELAELWGDDDDDDGSGSSDDGVGMAAHDLRVMRDRMGALGFQSVRSPRPPSTCPPPPPPPPPRPGGG
eukprot:COSAG04_NODE_13931_length_586_cov_1.702259_1_plen_74_part_01